MNLMITTSDLEVPTLPLPYLINLRGEELRITVNTLFLPLFDSFHQTPIKEGIIKKYSVLFEIKSLASWPLMRCSFSARRERGVWFRSGQGLDRSAHLQFTSKHDPKIFNNITLTLSFFNL